MRRVLRILIFGPLTAVMLVLMTAIYPVWRSTFWFFNDSPPPKGMVRELWQEWWDEVIIAP